ncbi:MAG: serine hydrolase [candidate division KSB1 bacterium]|nr:serine hydrolase [candidate division KSB1 bacterium]
MTTYLRQLEDSLKAEIAVSFYDFATGQYFGYRDTVMMHAASTMKVAVMIEVFRQAEAGEFSIEDSIRVKNEFRSIVDGSPYTLEVSADGEKTLYHRLGQKASIRELLEQMITRSSNLATNLLIEMVDAKNVTATMRELGADRIQVLRGVEDIKAYERGLSNRTSAHDLTMILRAIVENRAASPKSCQEMLDVLKRQQWRRKIPTGVPEGVPVANKTGSITRIDHDCAVIFPPDRKPYVLVVLTHGIEKHDKASETIAAISRYVWQAVAATNRSPN